MYSANPAILQTPEFRQSDSDLHKMLNAGKTFAMGSASAVEKLDIFKKKIDASYRRILDAQFGYFIAINFTKVNEDDVLPLIRQLIACVDLYLRLHVYKIAKIADLKPGEKDSDAAKFKSHYLDVFTEYTLSKIYNAYNRAKSLSDLETSSVTKMLRNVNPELKKIIGNAILQVFSVADLRSTSSDIISPVIAKIDSYLRAHPTWQDVISVKSLPSKN